MVALRAVMDGPAYLARAVRSCTVPLERQLYLVVMLARDSRVPWPPRAIVMAAIAYASCPVSLIPGVVTAVRQGIVLAVLGLGLVLARRMTPMAVIAEHRRNLGSLARPLPYAFPEAAARRQDGGRAPDLLFSYRNYRLILLAILLLTGLILGEGVSRATLGISIASPNSQELQRWLVAALGAALVGAAAWETRGALGGRSGPAATDARVDGEVSAPVRAAPGGFYDLLGYRLRWQIRAIACPPYVSDTAPIVIGGCGRSGTTLLPAILANHPRVFAGPESTVFREKIIQPDEIDRRFGLCPGRTEELQRLSRSHPEFIDRFQRECLRVSGKDVWTEKTPSNITRLPFIVRHFPRVRFVHVIRDGRDVVCSLRRQGWMKLAGCDPASEDAFIRCVAYWVSQVRAGRNYRGDPRYCEVDYADLVLDTETTLRRLTEFLGLEWDAALLETELLRGSLTRFDRLSRGDCLLDGSLVGSWRQQMSRNEIEIFKQRAGHLLVELGYERDMNWL